MATQYLDSLLTYLTSSNAQRSQTSTTYISRKVSSDHQRLTSPHALTGRIIAYADSSGENLLSTTSTFPRPGPTEDINNAASHLAR